VLQRLEPRVDARQQLERLKENLGAISVELTADDLREIESAASKTTIQGERYPEHLEKRTGL
jgi:diketogulonate reductase-like aldo/keto reductase